jgi:hypothetical protein
MPQRRTGHRRRKNDEIIRASLGTDSPHRHQHGYWGGQVNLAGFLLLQMLVRSAIGQVLTPKRRLSYPWLLGRRDRQQQLPNAYAWTTA